MLKTFSDKLHALFDQVHAATGAHPSQLGGVGLVGYAAYQALCLRDYPRALTTFLAGLTALGLYHAAVVGPPAAEPAKPGEPPAVPAAPAEQPKP